MIPCPKCGKELPDNSKFCDSCGTPVLAAVFCPSCGEAVTNGSALCPKCGAALSPLPPQAVPPAQPVPQPAPEPPKPKAALPKQKNLILYGGIAAAAVVVLILLVTLFSGKGGGSSNYALYFEDNAIVYTDFSKGAPLEVTERIFDGASLSGSTLASAASQAGLYVTVSRNGNLIFYPDRSSLDGDGITLYCRNLRKPNQEPVKIDSSITAYAVNDAADRVIYLKDSILYWHDLEEKEKISSDVTRFC